MSKKVSHFAVGFALIVFGVSPIYAQSSTLVPLQQFVRQNDISQPANSLYLYSRCVAIFTNGANASLRMAGPDYQNVANQLKNRSLKIIEAARRLIQERYKDPKSTTESFIQTSQQLMSVYAQISSRLELSGASLESDPIYGGDAQICISISQ